MGAVVRQLRRAVSLQQAACRSDAELLASFIDHRDEAAFAALVQRHGPIVLATCRRVVGDHHDAEDAFQATFLVLARKASSIQPREQIASWLHGVARRMALKARSLLARRRMREKQVSALPEPATKPHEPWRELMSLVDQELKGLPENYRLPVLLCDLGGKSIKQATRQLGWPQGTLAGRLARGRRLLAQRLARRGLVLPAGALAAIVAADAASAGLPEALIHSTVQLASAQAAAGLIPAKITCLMNGGMTAMMLAKLKPLLVLGVLALCLSGIAGLAVSWGQQEQTPAKAPEPDQVATLIQQLGHESFAKREAATRELQALGADALDALGTTAATSKDPEVRKRAEKLVEVISKKLERSDVKSVPPPKGATVLFDGKNLDAWVGREGKSGPTWRLLSSGVMEAQGADIQTWQTFKGAYKLHVEFRVPHMPAAKGQARGNSGIYLQGRYEVQILDSHGEAADKHSCGAIFNVAAPRVNACKAPAFWQSYDIEFYPAEFQNGTKVKNARVTVIHNGVLIHDKTEIPIDDTGQALPGDPSEAGPVLLQYFVNCPVQFRNMWMVPGEGS
jgi:RNA polymerase sigma factor (sigma-70 family)